MAAVLLGLGLLACNPDGQDTPIAVLYGAPPTVDPRPIADDDGDGHGSDLDCDDQNAAVHPGAQETPGDGVDSNCDGEDDT